MDNSPMPAWIKDAEGRYVFMNRRMLEIFELNRDSVLGRRDFEVFAPEDATTAREQDLLVLSDGVTREFQRRRSIGPGPKRLWKTCKFRLQADDGSLLVGGVALEVSAT